MRQTGERHQVCSNCAADELDYESVIQPRGDYYLPTVKLYPPELPTIAVWTPIPPKTSR